MRTEDGVRVIAEVEPAARVCAHCNQPVGAGDTVISYIEPDVGRHVNVVKMQIHDRCADAFFGPAKVQ